MTRYTWSRYPLPGKESYEVSSHGDKRFSAMWARLSDGRTIEEAYQLDIKGYRIRGNDWRLGKGNPPLHPMTKEQIWEAYKGLWQLWAIDHPDLVEELAILAAGKVLTDKFAKTEVSQARAWTEILNDYSLSKSFTW